MEKLIKILLIILLFYAIFLRFYDIEANLVFGGEHGENYLQIKNYVENKEFPLKGPITRFDWFSLGPLFYWIMIPFFLIFNFNPVIPAYFFAIISIIVAYVNYKLVKKWFNRIVAYVSTSLILISPLWLTWTARSRFYFLNVLFSYFYFYFFLSGLKSKTKNLYFAAFILGIMLNFHLSAVALVPIFIFYILLSKKRVNYIKLSICYLIPNIPLLIVHFQSKYQQVLRFLLWFPYRLAGFLGLIHKNNLTKETLFLNIHSLIFIFGDHILVGKSILKTIIGILFLMFTIWLTFKEYKKNKLSNISVFLGAFCIFYLVLFIHGNPPDHYYSSVLLAFPIVIGIFFDRLAKRIKMNKLIVSLFTLVLVVLSLNYHFPEPKVNYLTQKEIAKKIIDDAKGQKFSLNRVGDFDYYENNFIYNYQYLLWWMGNEPVEDSDIIYTIYEKGNDPKSSKFNSKLNIENIIITKEIKYTPW